MVSEDKGAGVLEEPKLEADREYFPNQRDIRMSKYGEDSSKSVSDKNPRK